MLRYLSHPLVVILFTIGAVLFSYSLYSNTHKTRISTEQVRVLEQEIVQTASEVSDLEKQLAVAQTPEAKEKIMRDELLLQKEGEIVVQLPEITLDSSTETETTPPQTPWQAWKQLLLE